MANVWEFSTSLGETISCCLWMDLPYRGPAAKDAELLSAGALQIGLGDALNGSSRYVAHRNLRAMYEALDPIEGWRMGPSPHETSTLVEAVAGACRDGRLVAWFTPPRRWTVSFAPAPPINEIVDEPSLEKSWVEVVVETDDGEPLPHRRLRVVLPDGSESDVTTNAQGRFRKDGVPEGTCSFSLTGARGPRRTHVVSRGECLTSIADLHGFADYRKIYEDGENAEFRKLRPDPHVIMAGDSLVIPENFPKKHDFPTGKSHVMKVRVPRRTVRLKLQGLPAESLAGKAFKVVAGDRTVDGKVTSDGLVEAVLPASATEATLTISELGLSLDLAIGDLDPVHDGDASRPLASGIQARLANLGRSTGSSAGGASAGAMDDATRAALAVFQREVMGREDADGAADQATLDALVREHGC